jgi:hypothetical protein
MERMLTCLAAELILPSKRLTGWGAGGSNPNARYLILPPLVLVCQ